MSGSLGDQLLAQGGFTDGGSVYGGSGAAGKGGSTDWNRVAQLLGNAGATVGKAAGDAAFDKRGGEGPGPTAGAGQGLSNLLATLIQMHRQAALAQQTVPLQPRVSLLG